MSKIILTNLGMVLTERCNFSCQHCMRGKATLKDMNIMTMKNTFRKVDVINNLTICGGEPLIDYDLFQQLITTLMDSGVIIGSYGFVTNGTNYTQRVEELLQKFDEYVHQFDHFFKKKSSNSGTIELSWDKYHQQQLDLIATSNPHLYEKYMSNIRRLVKSPYYQYSRVVDSIFNTGNAKELDDIDKVDIKYMRQFYYQKRNILYHGALLGILTDGIISECDGEFEVLRRNNNYGNINTDDLEKIILSHAIKRHSLYTFDQSCNKEYQKYISYK